MFDRQPPTPSLSRTLLTAGAGFVAGAVVSAVAKQFMPKDGTVRYPIPHAYGVRDPQFLRSMGGVLRPQIVPGNRITTLVNGDQFFPEMLDAIRSAQDSVTMETFIYWSGKVGSAFAEALADRARAGVRCHVLLDWLGSKKIDTESLERMKRAGVEVDRYHRHVYRVTQINHRTHRKLLVIDGKVGFTGGVGIADQWAGHAQDECHWRDNHYKIEGPVVAQLQSAFTDNWLKSQHVVLHEEAYFPQLGPVGEQMAQTFQSSPEEGSESMRLMYLLAVAAAKRSIRIATAYFVPDALSVDALLEARRRGVEVEILVPGPHIDVEVVRHASRERWGPLLEAGVRIYEYLPTMFHAKLMVVDDYWASIGSTNFDNRSFRLNDEANLNVYDEAFAREQVEWFERDKGRCREITVDAWRRRPVTRKVVDRGADLVGGML